MHSWGMRDPWSSALRLLAAFVETASGQNSLFPYKLSNMYFETSSEALPEVNFCYC